MTCRVAHLTFDMRIGGAERVIHTLTEHTQGDGVEVSLLCLEGELGPFGADLQQKGYEVTCLARRPGFDARLPGRIRSYVRRRSIDVVHCHQYSPYVYGVLGALGTGAGVVFTEHGRLYPDLPRWKRRLLNPWLARLTDRITAISRATKRALVEVENFPEARVEVIYNGIDGAAYSSGVREEARRSLGVPPDAFVLGTVARLDALKNQALMVRALAAVRAQVPEAVLLVVGDGPERGRLDDLARELGVAEDVLFTGFRHDVQRLYPAMDAFLLTSFTEGTAMTLLEAMASALPCVVTDVGGNPEIVVDGKTGWLIPSGGLEALVGRILELRRDHEGRSAMGRAGQARFRQRFSVESMARAYKGVYQDLTADRGGAAGGLGRGAARAS
jgi:glycosyltransferase involved in cell wall biosynthesis